MNLGSFLGGGGSCWIAQTLLGWIAPTPLAALSGLESQLQELHMMYNLSCRHFQHVQEKGWS